MHFPFRLVPLLVGLAVCSPPTLAAGPVVDPPGDPHWIRDPITGCSAWNPAPVAGESVLWTGHCRNGRLDGEGTLTWVLDGDLLNTRTGGWRDGRAVGAGVVRKADGVTIEADWVDGEVEGFVIARYPDGSPLFVGTWVHGAAQGKGTAYYLDGSRYEGEWVQGQRDGHGVFTTTLGDRYDGDWRADEGDGHVREEHGDGSTYDGEWHHSERDGQGVWRSASGASYTGAWCAGRRCATTPTAVP